MGVAKELRKLSDEPLDGIKILMNEEDITDVCADIKGPGLLLPAHCHMPARTLYLLDVSDVCRLHAVRGRHVPGEIGSSI